MLHRFPKLVLFIAAAALLWILPAKAEPDKTVESYKLANGLTVILAPSPSARDVAVVLNYKVGSANEQPGRSGFAHLFEHLMFEGTKAVPDFDKRVSAVGGDSNAFTRDDDTIYYLTGPKEALPTFLWLDAERMANLANAVTQADLDNQRQIVLNEMRQNVLDRPGGAAREQSQAELYPRGHPYAHSTIGSIADLNAATLEDVKAFHRIWYVPGNAILAITGNFDPAEAKALIGNSFGMVPASDVQLQPPAIPLPAKAQRLTFTDAVPSPVITIRWLGPAGNSRDTVIRDMAGLALSVGESALENQLVTEQKVASSVYAGWEGGRLGGTFTLYAAAAPGVDANRLESALRASFENIRNSGVTQAAIKTVQADFETSYASVPSNPLGYAFTLAAAANDVDPRDWRYELDMSKTVSVDEINAVLAGLMLDKAQISIVEPGPRTTNYPPVIEQSSGKSPPLQAASRADVPIAELATKDAATLALPKMTMVQLESGAVLNHYLVDDPAEVAVALLVQGGAADSPPGLSDLALSVHDRGAGDLSAAALNARMRDQGLSIFGNSGMHTSQIVATAPLKNLDQLALQLAEMVMKPRFDPDEWSAGVNKTVNSINQAITQPGYQASRRLNSLIFPAGSPEARVPSADVVLALKPESAGRLFKERMRPERVTFHVAAKLSPDTVAAALNNAFAGWRAAEPAKSLAGYTVPRIRSERIETEVAGATQAAIMAALPAPVEGTREATAFALAVRVLGGDAGSRLNAVLREEKGWSYGINAGAYGTKGKPDSILYVSTSVQADRTDESIIEMQKVIRQLEEVPVTDSELQAARRTMTAEISSSFGNASGTAMFAMSSASAGFSLQDMEAYLAAIETVSLDEVNRQAAIIAASPMAISVAKPANP